MSLFIDEITIEVNGGRGGHGMSSFRREKFVALGGPSGGNGGKGGDVIFIGDEGSTTLFDFRYQRHIKADSGENGKSRGMHGKNASNKYLKVPLGTIVYDDNTGKRIGEIIYHDQELVVAKGGKGGRGNMAFATNRNQAPRISENGDLGESLKLKVELKVLADVGIIGFPSVGKSTLISAISNARPKIADYPFTTLTPNLGMVEYKEHAFAVADLPGLIENASEGVGLGTRFLKHIERCRIFIHLVDATIENPVESYHIINEELKKYDEELSTRKQIIALNKIEMLNENELNDVINEFREIDNNIYALSAITKQGINELLDQIIYELENIPAVKIIDDSHQIYQLEDEETPFIVTKVSGGFEITGRMVELYYYRTNFVEEEAINRFARQLRTLGINEELKLQGAKNGDIIRVIDYEFEYLD